MKHSPCWILKLAFFILFPGLVLACVKDSTATVNRVRLKPVGFLQRHDAAVQDLLAQSSGDSLSPERREALKTCITAAFDFEELSRLSLDAHWLERTEPERREFVRVSTGIVREENFDRFLQYYREGKIDYQEENIDSTETAATVKALVTFEKGEQVDIGYSLHLVDAQWRVYDLSIDGASTVDGKRRQYARYIKKHSFEKLIQQLHKRLDRLTSGMN